MELRNINYSLIIDKYCNIEISQILYLIDKNDLKKFDFFTFIRENLGFLLQKCFQKIVWLLNSLVSICHAISKQSIASI